MHIFLNISRSKVNQTMKSGQLLESNLINIFLEKSYTKCGRETSRRPFSDKIKIEHISRSKTSNVLYSLFLLYGKLRAIEIYWN